MNFIYRIQDEDGRGPWKPGFSHQWVEDRNDHMNLPPWFAEFGRADQQATIGMSVGCGCKNLKQLRRWFTKREYKKLRKYGYHMVKMKVGRILAESDVQCVFERAKPLKDDVELKKLY